MVTAKQTLIAFIDKGICRSRSTWAIMIARESVISANWELMAFAVPGSSPLVRAKQTISSSPPTWIIELFSPSNIECADVPRIATSRSTAPAVRNASTNIGQPPFLHAASISEKLRVSNSRSEHSNSLSAARFAYKTCPSRGFAQHIHAESQCHDFRFRSHLVQ